MAIQTFTLDKGDRILNKLDQILEFVDLKRLPTELLIKELMCRKGVTYETFSTRLFIRKDDGEPDKIPGPAKLIIWKEEENV